MCIEYHIWVNMYDVSAQGVDERMINVHYYYYIKLLQFSSHGHSQLYNSTNAGSPNYCCTPYQFSSTMPSKLHTSPIATPLAPNF